ncbi:transposase [Paraburkholderia sp. J69-1]|uniref:transposase n=1 Tax=unclassified Paraburkholderia TaxID=2615204 RepID=UPI0039F114B2
MCELHEGRAGAAYQTLSKDEQREALRVVTPHPQARRIVSQRKAIVEPVFGGLRGRQGLNRFRRRGLAALRREFALHIMAHNLSRAVALQRALLAFQCATLRARLLARLPRFNRSRLGCLLMRFATASKGRGFRIPTGAQAPSMGSSFFGRSDCAVSSHPIIT